MIYSIIHWFLNLQLFIEHIFLCQILQIECADTILTLQGPSSGEEDWHVVRELQNTMGRAVIKVCITCYESTEVRELFLTKGLVRKWSKEDSPMRWWLNWVWEDSLDVSQQTRAEKAFQMLERAKHEGHNSSGKKGWKTMHRILWRALYVTVRTSSFILWWWRVRGGFSTE